MEMKIIKNLINAFLLNSKFKASTQKIYKKILNYFVNYMENRGIFYCDENILKKYFDFLTLNYPQNTISLYWNTLLDLFEFGEKKFNYPSPNKNLKKIPNIRNKKYPRITKEKGLKILLKEKNERNILIFRMIMLNFKQNEIVNHPNIKSQSDRNKNETLTKTTIRHITKKTFNCSPTELSRIGKHVLLLEYESIQNKRKAKWQNNKKQKSNA